MILRAAAFHHSPFTGANDEKGWVGLRGTQGSPRRLGRPWAELFDTVGVVNMRRCARREIAVEFLLNTF
jgi:hypothetical protein